jgi:hypothetical protein
MSHARQVIYTLCGILLLGLLCGIEGCGSVGPIPPPKFEESSPTLTIDCGVLNSDPSTPSVVWSSVSPRPRSKVCEELIGPPMNPQESVQCGAVTGLGQSQAVPCKSTLGTLGQLPYQGEYIPLLSGAQPVTLANGRAYLCEGKTRFLMMSVDGKWHLFVEAKGVLAEIALDAPCPDSFRPR